MATRRRLVVGLLAGAGAGLAWAWGALATGRRQRSALSSKRVSLPFPAAEGVTFHAQVLLVRDGRDVRAFSARCPHLGCRLSRVEAGEIVCPCHGSRFDRAGRALAGPAKAGLVLLTAGRGADGNLDVLLPG